MKSNARSKLLVEPAFQLSFLRYTSGLGLIVIALAYGANRYFFWKFAAKGREIGLPEAHVFFEFLSEQSRIMGWIYLATALLTVALIATFGLYLSNRIAGPIHRLRSHLASHLEGKPVEPLTFREDDYFGDLVEPLNSCLTPFPGQDKPQDRSKDKPKDPTNP